MAMRFGIRRTSLDVARGPKPTLQVIALVNHLAKPVAHIYGVNATWNQLWQITESLATLGNIAWFYTHPHKVQTTYKE